MKQLASADFRKQYQSQSEPVEVTAWGKVIGTWIPAGAAYEAPETPVEALAEPYVEPRMTIRPAKGPKKELTATPRRVLDPAEAAKLERERWTQLSQRMYGPKRPTAINKDRK